MIRRWLILAVLLTPIAGWAQPAAPPSEARTVDGSVSCLPAYVYQFPNGSLSCGTIGGKPGASVNLGVTPATLPWANITAGTSAGQAFTIGAAGSLRPLGGTVEANLFQTGSVNLPAITNTGMTAGGMYVGDIAAGSVKVAALLECADATPIARWNTSTLTWSCVAMPPATAFSPAGTVGICTEWGPGGTLVDAASGLPCGSGGNGGTPGGPNGSWQFNNNGSFDGIGNYNSSTQLSTFPGGLHLIAHPTEGSYDDFLEGQDDGTDYLRRKTPDTGWSATRIITLEDDGSPDDPLVSRNAFGAICTPFENLVGGDVNIELWMPMAGGAVVKSVGCHCFKGDCTTAAQLAFHDRLGNVLTGSAITCSSGTGNTTVAAVTGNGSLVQGEGLQFDVTNTPSPGNGYSVCFHAEDH